MDKDRAWLKDMALYARKALELAEGFDHSSFLSDTRTHLAVLHALVIVGEAAAQVSGTVRVELSGIPWGAIVGMRNKLVHHYFKADLDVVWKTVENDLPSLIATVEQYLDANPPPASS